MSRRPNASQALAMKAAALASRGEEDEAQDIRDEQQAMRIAPEPPLDVALPIAETSSEAPKRGRPKGRRPVAARQTIYLDEARHAALARIAEDRGRSVHSLILEGIDHVVGKPPKAGWQ